MRAFTRFKNRGFTLIELMIVVAIVGVLAALAIYGVRKYLLNSKTSEAKNAVGQMAKDAKTAFEREGMGSGILAAGSSAALSNNLCTTAPNIPATQSKVSGKKYQSAASEWTHGAGTPGSSWACLKFSLSDPQYYQYSYTGTSGLAGTFTAGAAGDLDGNNTWSSFTLSGAVTNGTVFVAPNFAETNPEE